MSPLALTSPDWNLLEDAYGTAAEVPRLLAQIQGPNAIEAVNELRARISHQASVYSSTIAAFPHLIGVASRYPADGDLHAELLCLAGAICESRELVQVLAKSSHREQFNASLHLAEHLTSAALHNSSDPNQALYLLKALAAFMQQAAWARVLDGIANDEFTLQCPSCRTELYVWPCAEGLFVAAEDPVANKQAMHTFVSHGLSGRSTQVEAHCWLEEQASACAVLATVRGTLPYLFGEALCPKCTHAFPLFDQLLEQAL